jgi:transposase InsO family protein
MRVRRAHRKWGPKRLVFEMGRRGLGTVTRSTVYRVLVRNQLIEPRSRRRRRQDYVRWERPVPMQLWQLDVTASAFLADGTEVKIVTGIDDHSRYCVIARAVMRATARPVCRAFVEAMTIYGVPEEVLTDNGTVFTGRFIKPRPAEVLFERICRENGITARRTRPRSPTTAGKIERLHQSLQDELLDVHGPRSPRWRRCRARWMPGGRNTTPTGRTSRWAWPSRPPGSSRRYRRCRCGCRPS